MTQQRSKRKSMLRRVWLIQIRESKQWTQKQVAERAFIDRSYYAQIETGERNPSFEVSKEIARVLGFHYSIFEQGSNPFFYALNHAPIILGQCDVDLRYTWIFNPHSDFQPDEVIGKTDTEINNNPGTQALEQLKQDVLEAKTPISRVITFPLSDGNISYQVFAHPLFDDNEKLVGVATASSEIAK
jgi:transcriptional regulator with XRE-family HTH domain